MSIIYRKCIAAVDKIVPSKLQPLWQHPAGPKTIFFWAPLFKWGLVIAGIADLQRPADKISIAQSTSLLATGAIWSRYSLVIKPKNWSLFSVNLFVALTQGVQTFRAVHTYTSLLGSIKMKIGNINSFNNRDLVIFLQKVGQHEAAKVVKKHQMNGRALLSFRSQKNTVDVTDVEKNHLLRCLTVIQLNPLHGVHLSPKCPSDDSNSISKPDDSFASHMYKQIILRTDNYTDDENGYIHVENVSLQEKDKQEYFKFISRRYKSLDNIVQNSEFNIINRSSTTSSGYIRPKSQIYIQRYEETAVNRVRKYSNQDEINGSEEHIYDRILQPSNIVINSVEDSGKINKKPFVLCNFLLNIFCFSCFINCKKV